MKYQYFDIHSHLTEERFDEVREDIAKEMLNKGIGTISIGTDQKESQAAVAFASRHPHIFASVGQHPADNQTEKFDPDRYQELIDKNREKIVCIGECGLDYYWLNLDLEKGKISVADFDADVARQKDIFKQQIDLAVTNNLPLMLHVRSYKDADAHRDTFEILDAKQEEHRGNIRANFHFFTETPEIAQEIMKRGFFVSFPGVITFANLDETVRAVPLERMFSETDSPYAAPKPYRGEDATPLMIPEMVKKIAAVKNVEEQEVQERLLANAQAFFQVR